MPKYFQWSEFDQKDGKLPGSGEQFMNHAFVEKLDALREACGFPFIITSAYRSPEYNAKVSTTGLKGPHTTGRAVDIQCSGERTYLIIKHAIALGFTGIGTSQSGPHDKRFIHLDDLTPADGFPRPYVWDYS